MPQAETWNIKYKYFFTQANDTVAITQLVALPVWERRPMGKNWTAECFFQMHHPRLHGTHIRRVVGTVVLDMQNI